MATNPYTEVTIVSYNASPPPDGGEQTAANEVTWLKHKTKLGDPLKTGIESTQTNLTTAFGKTINTDPDESNSVAGSIAFTSSELTIATGAITATRSHHTVDTEADAATDDLDTINTASVADGAELIIRAANTARTVEVKHGTGNIFTADDADFSLDDDEKSITLQRRGANWHEIGRSRTLITTEAITNGTAIATTSGTAHGFTSLPTGLKQIKFVFNGVSLSGTDNLLVQIGDSGGYETTGYDSRSVIASATGISSTSGFAVSLGSAANVFTGIMTLTLIDSLEWVAEVTGFRNDAVTSNVVGSGSKTLSAELDRIQVIATGSDTFDAGKVNISYELQTTA